MNLETVNSFSDESGMSAFGFRTELEQVDLAVGLGIPIAVMLVLFTQTVTLLITIPVVISVSIVTLSLVFMTPSHLNVKQYLDTVRYYAKHQGAVDNTTTATAVTEPDNPLNRIKVEETTRDMTAVDKFYPESNLIQRDDGSFVGALRIRPPNRDFDGKEDFLQLADKINNQLSREVDFQFQFHVTTRPFPIDEYVNELESRLNDKDIQEKPIMKAVLEERIEMRPEDLMERGTELPHYYLITSADPSEVNVGSGGTNSPAERLVDIPVIGFLAEVFVNIQDDAEDYERRNRVISRTQNRVSLLNAAIVGSSQEDFSSDVVSVAEWAELLRTLYNGGGSAGTIVRDQGTVVGQIDNPEIAQQIAEARSEGEPAVSGIDLSQTDTQPHGFKKEA